MGFLDNGGDILCDMCLTDLGRMRLAKGDGSFKIVKFAVADDEIDYSFYDGDHPSGSAYFDLNLLLTPVFEAFTDNAASMKHPCISIPRNNLLYLPILKVSNNNRTLLSTPYTDGMFYVAVDKDTETGLASIITPGLMYGETLNVGSLIQVDQGLDTTEISYQTALDPDLLETQYIVEMDNRFGSLANRDGDTSTLPSYIDDDDIASYYLSIVESGFVANIAGRTNANASTIAGPRGTMVHFKIKSSLELSTSDYLMDTIGSTTTLGGNSYKYIDSIIRVAGATTGASLNVPVRYIKLA